MDHASSSHHSDHIAITTSCYRCCGKLGNRCGGYGTGDRIGDHCAIITSLVLVLGWRSLKRGYAPLCSF